MEELIKDRIKVLYLPGFSEIVGGGQVSFLLLLKGLDRSKVLPMVICPDQGALSEKISALNIETNFLKSPEFKKYKLWEILITVVKLRRITLKNRIKIIQAETLYAAIYAGLASLFTNVSVIFHARTAESGRLLDKIAFVLSARIICVSRAVAKRFYKSGNFKKKIRVIYNGVDPEELKPMPSFLVREEYNIPSDAPVIGYCGQLVKDKGIEVLVKAFYIVKKKLPAAVLMLTGRGEEENQLKSMVKKLNIESSVIFTGYREDIHKIMSALDIFVLPTFYKEGLSRVIIEAMAAGKPVITTPLGGNPETVIEEVTGSFFSPGDYLKLAGLIINLFKDSSKLKRMGENGRQRAMEVFNININTEQIRTVYSELSPEFK